MTEYAWFDAGEGRQVYRKVRTGPTPARSHLPNPYFISDTMDPVEHPCDGKEYTSKAEFRRTTRVNGCIEVGNDPQRMKPLERKAPDRTSIRKSLQKAKARVSSGTVPA